MEDYNRLFFDSLTQYKSEIFRYVQNTTAPSCAEKTFTTILLLKYDYHQLRHQRRQTTYPLF